MIRMVCHRIIMECIIITVEEDLVVVVSWILKIKLWKVKDFLGRGRGGRGRGRFRQRGGANKENQPQDNNDEGKTEGKIAYFILNFL
jgi:hypothetical protein